MENTVKEFLAEIDNELDNIIDFSNTNANFKETDVLMSYIEFKADLLRAKKKLTSVINRECYGREK